MKGSGNANGGTPPKGGGHHERFSVVEVNVARPPHRFRAYSFEPKHLACCRQVSEGCLRAWQLTAEAYVQRIPETGFRSGSLSAYLNAFGRSKVPPMPTPGNITKYPPFTDLSEVLGIELLTEVEPDIVIPVPRVAHKESPPLQHHGIDVIGFRQISAQDYALYVIEVMASEEDIHPPSTVRDHKKQLYEETLNQGSLERLRQDLGFVHAECEEKFKPVLNGFIALLIRDRSQLSQGAVATAVLVRPSGMFDRKDWSPFLDSAEDFESAVVNSHILFLALRCETDFTELFRLVRASLDGSPPTAAAGTP